MVIKNTWIGLGRKVMGSDSAKRHCVDEAVAKCNFVWSPIGESCVVLGGHL